MCVMDAKGCFPGHRLTENDLLGFTCDKITLALAQLRGGKNPNPRIFKKGQTIIEKTLGVRFLLQNKESKYPFDINEGFTFSKISLNYSLKKKLGLETDFLERFLGNLEKLANEESISAESLAELLDYFGFVSVSLDGMPSKPIFP